MPKIFVSLRSRLTFYLLFSVGAVATIVIGVTYRGMSLDLEDKTGRYATLLLTNMRGKTEGRLRQIESAVYQFLPEWQEYIDRPDSMEMLLERMLARTPHVVGSGISFRPGYYSGDKARYMVYVYRGPEGLLRSVDLSNDMVYDYPNQSWFRNAVNYGRGMWSEPFFDKGGCNYEIVTYSLPLYDDQMKLIAVCTADLLINALQQRPEDMRPYPGSYSFILSGRGNFVITPDTATSNHHHAKISTGGHYRSHLEAQGNRTLIPICEKMVNGMAQSEVVNSFGSKMIATYAPVERMGWSVCTLIPYDSISEDLGQMTFKLLMWIVFSLLVLGTLSYYIVQRSLRPLGVLQEAALKIAQGDFDVELPRRKRRDEISSLRDSFASMQRSLKRYTKRLTEETRKQQAVESELCLAKEIQNKQLVTKFILPEKYSDVQLQAKLKTAQEVGGDFYDYMVRDKYLIFAVGDVAGKGVPAALLMSVTLTLFRVAAARCDSPEEIVCKMNSDFFLSNETGLFVTMLCGVLNMDTGELAICSAGHNPPMSLLPEGVCMMLNLEPNFPLAVFEDYDYKCDQFSLAPGTLLLFYTDGLTEAMNDQQCQFGEERALKILSGCGGLSADDLLLTLETEVSAFTAGVPQNDDLTLLAIKYKEGSAEVRKPVARPVFTPVSEEQQVMTDYLCITNDLNDISQLHDFVEKICVQANVDSSRTFQLNMALEEAVVNVMNYAYAEAQGQPILLETRREGDMLVFNLIDQGAAFNPLAEAPEADTHSEAEERPVGGLGVLLVRQLMDEVSYERREEKNILCMKKKISD